MATYLCVAQQRTTESKSIPLMTVHHLCKMANQANLIQPLLFSPFKSKQNNNQRYTLCLQTSAFIWKRKPEKITHAMWRDISVIHLFLAMHNRNQRIILTINVMIPPPTFTCMLVSNDKQTSPTTAFSTSLFSHVEVWSFPDSLPAGIHCLSKVLNQERVVAESTLLCVYILIENPNPNPNHIHTHTVRSIN